MFTFTISREIRLRKRDALVLASLINGNKRFNFTGLYDKLITLGLVVEDCDARVSVTNDGRKVFLELAKSKQTK
jgi:hypothetical protein